MGVQLNIKDPETVRLARELASSTGRTVTQTIRVALEREAKERDSQRAEGLMTAFAAIRAAIPPEMQGVTSKEMMDALYDKDGLPA